MNPAVPNNREKGAPSRGTRTAVASVAAIGSVLAASSCCLPVLPFVFAAGVAGGGDGEEQALHVFHAKKVIHAQ